MTTLREIGPRCPKCAPSSITQFEFHHPHLAKAQPVVYMEKSLIYPSFYLKDGEEVVLPWKEDQMPIVYICPKCGYVEMYIHKT